MVDVIKRRTTGVSTDAGVLVKIDMENISPASFSTGLPDSTAVTAGDAITLSVTVSGGEEPYGFQWYKNGNAISGAVNDTYTKSSAVTSDSGVYKVVARDGYGNIISDTTTVTVS